MKFVNAISFDYSVLFIFHKDAVTTNVGIAKIYIIFIIGMLF